MKINFNLDEELPLNKTIEIHSLIIVVRVAFNENNKYCPQVFLDECKSKVCDICHIWYFLCHDLLMMSLNLSNIAILKKRKC